MLWKQLNEIQFIQWNIMQQFFLKAISVKWWNKDLAKFSSIKAVRKLVKIVRINFYKPMEIKACNRLESASLNNRMSVWTGSFVNFNLPLFHLSPRLQLVYNLEGQQPIGVTAWQPLGARIWLELLESSILRELSLVGLSGDFLGRSSLQACLHLPWIRALTVEPFIQRCLSENSHRKSLTLWLPAVVEKSWGKQQTNQQAQEVSLSSGTSKVLGKLQHLPGDPEAVLIPRKDLSRPLLWPLTDLETLCRK